MISISDLLAFFRQGKALTNGDTLRNRASAYAAIYGLLLAAYHIAIGAGVHMPFNEAFVASIANWVTDTVLFGLLVVHTVGSPNIGLPAKPSTVGSAGGGATTGPRQTPNAGG